MLYAPLGRVYTETYAKDADMDKLIPYTLNKVQRPSGMSDALAYLYNWKKNWSSEVSFWTLSPTAPSMYGKVGRKLC